MKNLLLALMLILGFSASLIAQPMSGAGRDKDGKKAGKPGEANPRKKGKILSDKERERMEKEMHNRRMKMLREILDAIAKKYDLTEEQKNQLEGIFTALLENQQKMREEMKKEMNELKKKHDEELKKLLGDKYEDFKKEMNKLQKAKENRRGRERENRMTPDKIAKLLELSDEQKKKFIKAFDKMLKQMSALRKEAGKGGQNKEKMAKKLEGIYKNLENALKEILTVNQWEKFNKLRKRIFPAPGKRPEPKRMKPFDPKKFADELGLSEAQKNVFGEILKKHEKARKELMETLRDSGLSGKEIMEKVKKLSEKFDIELKKILTPEQMKKLNEMRRNAAKLLRERDPRNQRKNSLEQFLKALELNEEQKKAVKQFIEDFREASEKLREERGNAKEMREKLQALYGELMEKIKSQLNDEQKKKMESMLEKLEEFRKKREESRKEGRPERPRNPDRPKNPEKPVLPK